MAKFTVVCRESEGDFRDTILIYVVNVATKGNVDSVANQALIQEAVENEREKDIGESVEMEVLFAFAGDVEVIADWR